MPTRYYVGGGNVAGILGVSPYRTPVQEYQTIIGDAPEISEEQRDFFEGRKDLEAVAAKRFMRITGQKIVRMNRRYTDADVPFIKAEIDLEPEQPDATIECKSVRYEVAHLWGESGTNDYPMHVAAQGQHGLMVTGRQVCYIVALLGFDDTRIYEMRRDDDIIAAIREQEIEFWHKHVLPRIPPPPQTLEDVQTIFRRANGRPVELDAETADMVRDLRIARAEIRDLEKREKDLQFGVASAIWRTWKDDPRLVMHVPTAEELYAMDDAELRFDGKTVATWKKQARTALDAKALQAAHPDICAQFMKQSQFRVMRTK